MAITAIGQPRSAPTVAILPSRATPHSQPATAADTNGKSDVYVYDRLTHTTERVSVGVTHSSQLTALQNDFVVNAVTSGAQNQAAVTPTADGGFIVTWTTPDASGTGIHAAYYDHFGHKAGDFSVNSNTVGNQSQSAIAGLEGGGVVVVWTTAAQNGAGSAIHGQMFNSGGAVGNEFQLNAVTPGDQSAPAITALANGGFVATWQSAGGANGSEISARVFDATGIAQGNQFQVNTFTAKIRRTPRPRRLLTAASSSFGSRPARMAAVKEFTVSASIPTAMPAESNLRSTAPRPGDQSSPSITALNNGEFVVTWQSALQDGSLGGIYGQIYSSTGAAVGGEFLVNHATFGDQSAPSITALEDGGFLVAFQSQTANGYDIVARRFDSTGLVVSDDTTLNVTTAADQTTPQLVTLSNGSVVALWQGPDGNGATDVFARIFSDVVKTQSTADSYRPEITPDGRYVIFGSDASLTSNDTNIGDNTADTYVYDRATQTIQLVSHDQLGKLGAGYESIGDASSVGGVVDTFGAIALAFRDGPPSALVPDGNGKILLASGPFADLVSGDDALTMTLRVAHGKLAPVAGSGLTYVLDGNGHALDGQNGILKVTGTAAAISAATQTGLIYTPTGSGNDAMIVQVADASGASFSTSVAFAPDGSEVTPLSFSGGGGAFRTTSSPSPACHCCRALTHTIKTSRSRSASIRARSSRSTHRALRSSMGLTAAVAISSSAGRGAQSLPPSATASSTRISFRTNLMPPHSPTRCI